MQQGRAVVLRCRERLDLPAGLTWRSRSWQEITEELATETQRAQRALRFSVSLCLRGSISLCLLYESLCSPSRSISISCSRTAARITLASCPWSAVSCSPSGNPLATGMGIEMAGVPKAVHGRFIRASPVDARPMGAGPVAAGTRITGVDLYSSTTVFRHCRDVPSRLLVSAPMISGGLRGPGPQDDRVGSRAR